MRRLVILTVVFAIAGAIYLMQKRGGAERRTVSNGTDAVKLNGAGSAVAPALSVTDLNGKRIETSSYAGKVVLVNFWAAWCTPCADEVPKIMSLQERYGARGFQVIGFSMDDTDRALRGFYAKYKMNYPVVPGSAQIAESYGGILGLPTTLLISRDGHIAAKYSGLTDFKQIEGEVVRLLGER
jgi:peroxiredoxin